MDKHIFRAMGTEVELLASPHLHSVVIRDVEEHFERVEAALSRFRPESELSQLNLSAGRPFAASPLLREVLGEAIAGAERSGGLVDPTVLYAMQAAGYRESIEKVRGDVQLRTEATVSGAWRNIDIGDDGTITLPPGCGIDLGGFAKGWTVDHAAELMAPCDTWLINAGGDLLAHGAGPDGQGWVVGIEDPFRGPDVGVLRISDAAVGTSTTQRRRWQTQSGVAHHIIDPRTGAPSETDLASVTVVTHTLVEAEVYAKTVLLLGGNRGREYAEAHGLRAILVDDAGAVTAVGALGGCLVG